MRATDGITGSWLSEAIGNAAGSWLFEGPRAFSYSTL